MVQVVADRFQVDLQLGTVHLLLPTFHDALESEVPRTFDEDHRTGELLGTLVPQEHFRIGMEACGITPDSVPQMKQKGRLQVGKDADVVVFDLATVSDKATFTAPNQRSVGMKHVVVNGVPVIREGELVRGALPGRAIRRAVVETRR